MSTKDLTKSTRQAAKEEEERKKRVAENQKLASRIRLLLYIRIQYIFICIAITFLETFRLTESNKTLHNL